MQRNTMAIAMQIESMCFLRKISKYPYVEKSHQNSLFISTITSSAIIVLLLTACDFSNAEKELGKYSESEKVDTIVGIIEEPPHSVTPGRSGAQLSTRQAPSRYHELDSIIIQRDRPPPSYYPNDLDNPESPLRMSPSIYGSSVVDYGDLLDVDSIHQEITESFEVEEIGPLLDADQETYEEVEPRYIGEPMDADSGEHNESFDSGNGYEVNIGHFIDLDVSN